MTDYDDELEKNLVALINPNLSDIDAARKVVDMAGKFATIGHPAIAAAIQVVTWTSGFFLDKKKSARVTPVILGLYARMKKLEGDAQNYVRKPEAQALIENALARIANQPDESRQTEMRRILEKILEEPRDPADSKLFLRLADELPVPALKLLAALHVQSGRSEAIMGNEEILAARSDLSKNEVKAWLRYLVNESLVDEEQLNVVQHGTFENMLTNVGALFEYYRRS